jgi:hypothetical protein
MSYKFNIEEFPIFYGRFSIPKGTILYLNIQTNYYNFKQTNSNNKIFKTKKEIQLYDFRYVKKILLDLLAYCKKDTESTTNICKILALSYGICSLERQLELVKDYYSSDCNLYKSLLKYYNSSNNGNLVQLQGIRIVDEKNDMLNSHLLKYLLRHMVDGTITNKMYSLDDNKLVNNVEIMLFYVDKNNLLEEIEEVDIQIKKVLDWNYWIDYYNEVHYRDEQSDTDFFINIGNNNTSTDLEQIKKIDDFAEDVISKLINHTSLVPFTPKFTALEISPWPNILVKHYL